MSDFRDHVQHAVELAGSQKKLAEALGCSQQAISKLLNEATSISAEMAIRIDRATGGKVAAHTLRPDLFLAPSPASTPREAEAQTA
jgi:DNA-binding transcriptional regulator YdaS (Cro superfamily)